MTNSTDGNRIMVIDNGTVPGLVAATEALLGIDYGLVEARVLLAGLGLSGVEFGLKWGGPPPSDFLFRKREYNPRDYEGGPERFRKIYGEPRRPRPVNARPNKTHRIKGVRP